MVHPYYRASNVGIHVRNLPTASSGNVWNMLENTSPRQFVTRMQAAELLGVTDRTIYSYRRSGRLTTYFSHLNGRTILLDLDEVQELATPGGVNA